MSDDTAKGNPAGDAVVEVRVPKRRRWRHLLVIIGTVIALVVIIFFICFPGRQFPMAFTLATGIGVGRLQERIDGLEEKAITGAEFSPADKRFLSDFYTCLAKGGRWSRVAPESGRMLQHYLKGSGTDLAVDPAIFLNSGSVGEQMKELMAQIERDQRAGRQVRAAYRSETFYMGDAQSFDTVVGLYYGTVSVTPRPGEHGLLVLRWRAECLWEWPSYGSLFEKYGDYHAQCFPLPNLSSLVFGSQYCLLVDDGLGGKLPELGLARPFLVTAEWQEHRH